MRRWRLLGPEDVAVQDSGQTGLERRDLFEQLCHLGRHDRARRVQHDLTGRRVWDRGNAARGAIRSLNLQLSRVN